MKLQLTKNDFRKMVIACNESTSCYNCAFRDYCTELGKDKGEIIAEIAEVMPDAEVEG